MPIRTARGSRVAPRHPRPRGWILSFPAPALPAQAQVAGAILTLIQSTTAPAGNPPGLGPILVDVALAPFGDNPSLQSADWGAIFTGGTLQRPLRIVAPRAASQIQLQPGELSWVNTTSGGRTQMRVRFTTPTSNNRMADQVQWYTANYTTATARPKLEVLYTAP